jgi:N-acetylmuramoyl-L-alanine amidase
LLVPAALVVGLATLFWPWDQLRSDNFVFYFPSGHHELPLVNVGNAKYLPVLQILNMVGKVGETQEKRSSLRIQFGTSVIELQSSNASVRVNKTNYRLLQPVVMEGDQWLVPVEFLTVVLPHLTHQAVEYQEGTNRIFVGDIRPASFTVRVDPIANGARLTVQFTEKVAVRTASSNGKWVMYLGDQPIEPMEPAYHFQNPYLSELRYDDQDGVPKLILSPAEGGLNFYPMQAEGGKILLADVLKPPPASAQALPGTPATQGAPSSPQSSVGRQTPQAMGESPAAPPGVPLPVVTLDAGHGGSDNGGHSRDGVLEKDLVMQYVARVRIALLATQLYRVVLTRTADVNVTSEQRALAANLSGAVCFISFHAGDLGMAAPRITVFTFQPPSGATPNTAETPPPVFVPWGQVQDARLAQSVQLAAALQQQLATINGTEVDSPATAPARVLRSVNAPAVAIELGRLSPDQDAAALTDPAFQQHVAESVVQALAAFSKGATNP